MLSEDGYYRELLADGVEVHEYVGGLLHAEPLTAELQNRQETFLASSRVVTLEEVDAWSAGRRLWDNTIGMLGPLL